MKTRSKRPAGGDEHFPDRLLTERLRWGLSHEKLSRASGGHPTAQTISSWERGLRKPRMDDGFRLMSLALRTTPLYLLYGEK